MRPEEIAKMTWDERHEYFKKLEKDPNLFDNPLDYMTSVEEIEAYSAIIGAEIWDKFL